MSTSGANDISTFNDLLKTVYEPLIPDIVKTYSIVASMIPFSADKGNPGRGIEFPLLPTLDHSVHFNVDGSAFQLTDPGALPLPSVRATVQSAIMMGRMSISYALLKRANSEDTTFDRDLKDLLNLALKSLVRNVELNLINGQQGLGTSSSASFSGTEGSVVLTLATWASGIWVGMEGAYMDMWSSAAIGATKRNTNAAIIVTRVDQLTRTVYFSCNSSDASSLGSGGVLYRRGSRTSAAYLEPAGIDKIFSNTGILFGIDANQYQIWKGNTIDVGSQALTMGALQRGIVQATTIGGLESDCVVLLSPKTWATVLDDLSALRSFDSSYKSQEVSVGSSSIVFHSMNGKMEFVSHPYVKESVAYAFPKSVLRRCGTSEPIFWKGASGKGDYLKELPDNAGYEVRTFTDQGLYVTHPARCVIFTGIVNPDL